jgi:hypothetical protein
MPNAPSHLTSTLSHTVSLLDPTNMTTLNETLLSRKKLSLADSQWEFPREKYVSKKN